MLDKLKDLDTSDIQEVAQLIQAAQTLEPLIDAALATVLPWIQKLREPIEGLHDWQTSLDVKRFKAYIYDGMSADQAITLMVNRKQEIAHAIASAAKPKKS